uniref:Uncharacterized protein n=1 Tax=Amphora coffeiformis TaxID=265554 RepID=A0A7S3LCE9_9STRA
MKWKTPKKIESNPNDQALLGACREGDPRLAQDCIRRGAKIDCVDNESGWMPLHCAVAGLHVETVQVLLESDANPDLIAKANGMTPLGILVRLEKKPATRLQQRLRKRGSLSDQEEKVLMIAEALLRFGADPSGCVDIQSESTPLHIAASQGRLELVKLLLEYGALMIHCPEEHSHLKLKQRQQQKRPSWKVFGDSKPAAASIPTTTHPTTPLGISCRTGQVAVMDYLLSALPPQALESSYVLQQALQEAQRNDQMECLVGLWEYSEEVLSLDSVVEGGEVDPARKASLVQSFFDIFTRNANHHHDHAEKQDEDASQGNTSTDASWLHVLQEACRRRSVNLLEPLLQRLPQQQKFFQKLRKQPSMSDIRANLIQAVDPRDHQTLLHRYCTAPTTTSTQGNLIPDEEQVNHPSHPATLGWISRLLQLSRECDETEMEEMRLKAAAAANSKGQEQRYANYENDSKFTMETSEIESESDDSSHSNRIHRQQQESGSHEVVSSSQEEQDSDSSEENSGSEEDESGSEEESSSGAGTGEECSVHSQSDSLPPVSDLQISQQANTHDDSDLDEDSSEDDDPEEEDSEAEEDESSYFIESQTCSESEDDGIGSEMSSGAEAELQSSFAIAIPLHSGKDLVNAGDANLQTALHLASSTGFIPAIELLLQEENILVNAPDCLGNTPLLVAERTDVIRRLLLDRRTDVNLGNYEGTTPLLKATQSGDMVVAQIFLQNGADLEIGDRHGRTPLYLACARGCTDSCAYLLAYGANPNATTNDDDRDTPLHAACRGGHLGVILRLFTADVEAKDANGRTPLHVACCVGQVDVVEYLVTERHANLNVQDKNGLTPFEVACHAGRDSVVYYLVRYHTSHLWDRKASQRFFSKCSIPSLLASKKNEYETFSLSSHDAGSYRDDPFSYSQHLFSSSSDDYTTTTTDPYSPSSLNISYDDYESTYNSYRSSLSKYDDEPFVYSSFSRYGRSSYEADSIYY